MKELSSNPVQDTETTTERLNEGDWFEEVVVTCYIVNTNSAKT